MIRVERSELTFRLAASPSVQLFLSECSIVPLFVLKTLLIIDPDVCLGFHLFTFNIAFSRGFISFCLEQTHADGLEFVLAAFEHVETVDVAIGEASDIGAADRVTFTGDNAGVVAVLDAGTFVVVEDGGGLVDGLDVVFADCGGAEDDLEEDFLGHQCT